MEETTSELSSLKETLQQEREEHIQNESELKRLRGKPLTFEWKYDIIFLSFCVPESLLVWRLSREALIRRALLDIIKNKTDPAAMIGQK